MDNQSPAFQEGQAFLDTCRKQFLYYKDLGEKAMAQVPDEALFLEENGSNSMAMVGQHLAGNMLSRWTNFFTEDGEKSWRNREEEFEPILKNRLELMTYWDKGWTCFLDALNGIKPEDLSRIIFIRNQVHTVMEAILRQLAHYPYHVGQLVLLAKGFSGLYWQSLSIPRGDSSAFNKQMFDQKKKRVHFLEEQGTPGQN